MSANVLSVKSLTMQFGGLKAVTELNLEVEQGTIFGLIGPNGAGKTTVFNMLTGVYQPTLGQVVFRDQVLNGLKPYQISNRGLTRTFQNIRLFKNLSVSSTALIFLVTISPPFFP